MPDKIIFKIAENQAAIAQAAAEASAQIKTEVQELRDQLDVIVTNINDLLALQQDASKLVEVNEKLSEILDVQAKLTEIETVANNLAIIQSVEGELTAIANLNAKLSEILQVESKLSEIDTIVDNLTELLNLETEVSKLVELESKLSEVLDVQSKLSEIENVSNNLSTLVAVENSLTELQALESKLTELLEVESKLSDIEAVAGITGDVTTVAGISGAITTLAGISAEITTLAGLSSELSTLAGISGDITTVAGIDSQVSTVAGIESQIQTVVDNLQAILDAPAEADRAKDEADKAEEWATKPEDQPVETDPDRFSAFHWAQKAFESASGISTYSNSHRVARYDTFQREDGALGISDSGQQWTPLIGNDGQIKNGRANVTTASDILVLPINGISEIDDGIFCRIWGVVRLNNNIDIIISKNSTNYLRFVFVATRQLLVIKVVDGQSTTIKSEGSSSSDRMRRGLIPLDVYVTRDSSNAGIAMRSVASIEPNSGGLGLNLYTSDSDVIDILDNASGVGFSTNNSSFSNIYITSFMALQDSLN